MINVNHELRNIWDTISKDEVKNLDFDLKLHKKLLDIFQVGSYYYYIVNVRKSLFEIVSPEMETILGYPLEEITLDYFVTLLHPDDLPFFLNFENAVAAFFANFSGEQLFKYKVQYDFRIKKADDHYIRVLHQFIVFHFDAEDVKTFAIDTDITHFKSDLTPQLSFIGLEGEPSYINVDVNNIFTPIKHILTKREREILKALVNGKNSTEIGELLNISRFTVDVHRKNMLKKTETKSTYEIIQMAYNKGWI
jgi:DNA-binding CsgD family transcriptional regulator